MCLVVHQNWQISGLQTPFHDQGLQLMFKAFEMQDNNNIVIRWEDPLLLIYGTKNWMMMMQMQMMMTARAHKIGAPPLRWAALISIIFPFNLADWFHHVRIGITHRIWWWQPCAWSNLRGIEICKDTCFIVKKTYRAAGLDISLVATTEIRQWQCQFQCRNAIWSVGS